jgi:putative endonuclease
MLNKRYWVYILGGFKLTLYIGVTNDLVRRVWQHRTGTTPGFASRYHATKLLYFEEFNDPVSAIAREKQLKNWHRAWKLNLIRSQNPDFKDLYVELVGPQRP